MPAGMGRILGQAQRVRQLTVELARAASAAGIPWAVENPADRGEEGSPAWWRAKRDHGSSLEAARVRALQAETAGQMATFPQCALGARVQKYTSLMHSASMLPTLSAWQWVKCTCPEHAELAHGRGPDGSSRAEAAAAYPARANELIADALSLAARAFREERDAADERGARVGAERQTAQHYATKRVALVRQQGWHRRRTHRCATWWRLPRASSTGMEMPASMGAAPARDSPRPRSKKKGRPLPAPTVGGEAECDACTGAVRKGRSGSGCSSARASTRTK